MFDLNNFALGMGLKGRLRLNRTWNQNFVMASILFCLPGIYLAIVGLGAGGGQPTSQHVVSTASAITFGVFAVSGWFGGTLLNVFRPKIMIMLAATGYPLYIGSLWYFDRHGHPWFPYLAGVLLGITAGMLWTSASFIAFAYAIEDEKATFISWQWAMTSAGGTVGSLIAFGINYSATASHASNAMYTVFIVIQSMAILIAFFFIVDPRHVTRDDNTHIAVFQQNSVATELKRLFTLFVDWKVWILVPGIFVAEMNLTTMSIINAYYYNIRTRSLNNVCLQLIMVPCPLLLAALMDTRLISSRKVRGVVGVVVMGCVCLGTSSAAVAWIVKNNINRIPQGVDWTDDRFGAGFAVMLFQGVVYGTYQIAIQWVLSALSNDPDVLARYAGLFRGTTGLGLCVSFILDAAGVSFLNQVIVQFVLFAVGITALLVIIFTQVRDTNYFLEDNVIVPHRFEEKLLAEGVVNEEQIGKEKVKEEMATRIDEKNLARDFTAEVSA